MSDSGSLTDALRQSTIAFVEERHVVAVSACGGKVEVGAAAAADQETQRQEEVLRKSRPTPIQSWSSPAS